ncbi:MAG: tetraacyldisaccharide 4'-kinase [Rikenellaceae bacterium]
MIKRVALAPISYLYLAVVKLRHYLFDHSFLKSERFTTPIICVGNITVGGTGKSPMSELLLSHLIGSGRNVALLSRGYGRKNRGYVEVCSFDNYLMVGDEPLQMKRKFHDAVVVVCERRVEGVRRILSEHPDVEVIVMDDGFQHRHITPRANIIMVDATRPIDRDMPLPSGSLRDTTSSLKRADIFIVTKCPDSMGDEEMERIERSLLCREGQTIYFTQIETLDPRGALPEACESLADGAEVIALSGLR